MKKIEIEVFEFDELSDAAKENARQWYRSGGLDYEWWDGTCEDAKNIGLKITSFDTGRSQKITGHFLLSAIEVAANIIQDHGDACETRKTAENFLAEHDPVFGDYMNEESENYESRKSEDKLQEIEEDFLKSLLEDYLILLRNEIEYLQSDEAVDKSIISNEYTFTEEGKLFGN